MSDNLSNALLLMIIGMVTVFAILSIVVISGRFLINIINRFAKEPPLNKTIPKEHIAVISAVAASITDGAAHELKIDKL